MKKLLSILWVALIATTAWASRTFDGTEAIYLNAGAVTWWTDANAVQRAVLDNTTPVIGNLQEGKNYAFTIPAGSYTTIRFERAETSESAAWNATGDIAIDQEKNYVETFAQNSSEATWGTYVAPQEGEQVSIYFINYPQWTAPRVHLWGGAAEATTWPGAEMNKLEEKINGCDVYQFTAQYGDYANCIFSDNGANQTANLTWNTGKYYYINAWYTRENLPQAVETYHLYVINQTDWTTFDLYAWGTPSEPFGAWPGKTDPATVVIDEVSYLDYPFTVTQGGTVSLTLLFHNNVGEGLEGDHRIQLSIAEARDHYLTISDSHAGEDAQTMVLSINNSLIDYNDQYAMFNSMSDAMGKDARWTKHTNLGKTLAYHYNDDPLTPNAKAVVAGTAWTHIILQEQSSLPRTDLATFYSNVQTWVTYIRTNCPNPDAEIILPVNWAYSGDPDYQTNNATLIANYKAVADDFNLTLCPVAVAYGNYQLDHPASIGSDLYSDDRHPTPAATYLACCLEYATIFGENPSTITWKPDGISAEMAARMRSYAQEAYEGTQRTEPTPTPEPEPEPLPDDAVVLNSTAVVTEDFNSLGGAALDPSTDTKTGIAVASTLPQGWKIERNTTAPRQLGAYADAAEATMYVGGQSLASNAYNGTWNFGATGSDDRAVGGLTTGVADGTRGINLMTRLYNNTTSLFKEIALSYDIEKYRNGSNAAGFTVQLYTSVDGVNWTSAGDEFKTSFAPDADNNGYASVPAATTRVSNTLAVSFPANTSLYLAWSISVTSGTTCNAAPGLAIDNVSITPDPEPEPEPEPTPEPLPDYAVVLNSTAVVTEDFNSLGGAALDPSTDTKTGIAVASTLPQGWKIERNTTAPRQLGAYADAAEATMYVGGQSLASNAYNGTWNFGATGSDDRAVGGLTTGVADGTRGINLMTRLYNNTTSLFKEIALSYDIEKYRNGSNAAGFTVQLYTSVDGVNWTSAGDEFKTSFAPDADNNGYASVPAATTRVSNTLAVSFPANTSLYLAWSISVTSGTTCNAAPGLAIDNVSLQPKKDLPTDWENSARNSAPSVKILRNGQLYIMYKGTMYNVQGSRVR